MQSITWLILSRALSGVGGGGIVSSVWTITSEIVPVHKRAHWSQALSVEFDQNLLSECRKLSLSSIAYLGVFRGRRPLVGWVVQWYVTPSLGSRAWAHYSHEQEATMAQPSAGDGGVRLRSDQMECHWFRPMT